MKSDWRSFLFFAFCLAHALALALLSALGIPAFSARFCVLLLRVSYQVSS